METRTSQETKDLATAVVAIKQGLEAAAQAGFTAQDLRVLYAEIVLKANEGNKSAAAKQLGINRRTLLRMGVQL